MTFPTCLECGCRTQGDFICTACEPLYQDTPAPVSPTASPELDISPEVNG